MLKLEINPRLEIAMVQVTEKHACAVVDDFLLNPEQLVEYASAHTTDFEAQDRAYPGEVFNLSNSEVAPLNRFIQSEFSRIFKFCRSGIEFYTQLSITTLQPEQFSWVQRLCHTDPELGNGRHNYAALLYLFDRPELGGTGFYRWKDVDFWTDMTTAQLDDPEAGLEQLQQQYQLFRDPPSYMTDSNEAADLIDAVPARFNRLVFYSGDLPHSAFIKQPELLTPDPTKGRLTLNCFASVLPKN